MSCNSLASFYSSSLNVSVNTVTLSAPANFASTLLIVKAQFLLHHRYHTFQIFFSSDLSGHVFILFLSFISFSTAISPHRGSLLPRQKWIVFGLCANSPRAKGRGEIESRNVGILTGRKWRGWNSARTVFVALNFLFAAALGPYFTDLPRGNKYGVQQIGWKDGKLARQRGTRVEYQMQHLPWLHMN